METPRLGAPQAIIVAGLIVAGAIMLTRGTVTLTPSTGGKPAAATSIEVRPVTAGDHILGSADASVYVVEFSDLECPFCKTFQPTLHELLRRRGAEVAWVYRHFPLPIHPKAPREAEAAECAAEQGGNDAFFRYIDRLFLVTTSNNTLDPEKLPAIAGDVGLDVKEFDRCLVTGTYKGRVSADLEDGIRAGVTGTPSVVIINRKTGKKTLLVGSQPLSALEQAVDSVK